MKMNMPSKGSGESARRETRVRASPIRKAFGKEAEPPRQRAPSLFSGRNLISTRPKADGAMSDVEALSIRILTNFQLGPTEDCDCVKRALFAVVELYDGYYLKNEKDAKVLHSLETALLVCQLYYPVSAAPSPKGRPPAQWGEFVAKVNAALTHDVGEEFGPKLDDVIRNLIGPRAFQIYETLTNRRLPGEENLDDLDQYARYMSRIFKSRDLGKIHVKNADRVAQLRRLSNIPDKTLRRIIAKSRIHLQLLYEVEGRNGADYQLIIKEAKKASQTQGQDLNLLSFVLRNTRPLSENHSPGP